MMVEKLKNSEWPDCIMVYDVIIMSEIKIPDKLLRMLYEKRKDIWKFYKNYKNRKDIWSLYDEGDDKITEEWYKYVVDLWEREGEELLKSAIDRYGKVQVEREIDKPDSDIESRFDKAYSDWVKFCRKHFVRGPLSEYPIQVRNEYYKRILALGPHVLPLMIEKMRSLCSPDCYMVYDIIGLADITITQEQRRKMGGGVENRCKFVMALWEKHGEELLKKAIERYEAEQAKKKKEKQNDKEKAQPRQPVRPNEKPSEKPEIAPTEKPSLPESSIEESPVKKQPEPVLDETNWLTPIALTTVVVLAGIVLFLLLRGRKASQ